MSRLDELEKVAVQALHETYRIMAQSGEARFWAQKGIEGMRLAIALENQESPEGDVREERLRQDAKWGEQNHEDYKWLAILVEEVGEAAQEALTADVGAADGNGHGDLRQEVVEVAAVALAWIEAMDRRQQ